MMSTETQCSPEAEGSTNCGQMQGRTVANQSASRDDAKRD